MHEAGVRFVFMDCRPSLVSFYERFGFRRYAEPFLHRASGRSTPLVMLLGDTRHLERIGSPLAPLAAEFGADDEAIEWFETLAG